MRFSPNKSYKKLLLFIDIQHVLKNFNANIVVGHLSNGSILSIISITMFVKKLIISVLCNTTFSSKQMRDYHVTHNVCVSKEQKTPKLVLKMDSYYESMDKETLIAKIRQLESTSSSENQTTKQLTASSSVSLTQSPTTTKLVHSVVEGNVNVNSNNGNTNIIIFPCAFGTEKVTTIQEKVGDVFKVALKHAYTSISTLFREIHLNDRLPEYHNVYVSCEKTDYAKVSDGTEICDSFKTRCGGSNN